MAYITRHRVALKVTTSGGAAHTFYTPLLAFGGYVEAAVYTRPASSGISTNANLAITGEQSGLTILNCSATGTVTHYPRAAAENTAGAALGYTSAATPPAIPTLIPLAQEAIKIIVSSGGACSGGDGLTATLDLYVSGA